MKRVTVILTMCVVFCLGLFCLTACGKDGVDGKSAYQIWLDNGHTGTEADFLEWLKGDTPTVEINEDGYWVINGVDTGVKARADVKASQGLKYEEKDGGYIVKGMDSCTDTDLVIPSSYNGKPVTGIAEGAFYNCTTIKSVTILDGVKNIGGAAFYYCTSIEKVVLPDSIETIGYMAFSTCRALTDINLPDSIQSIGHQGFYYCTSLTSITLPKELTSIEDLLFCDCSALESVTMGDKIQSIGNRAFYGTKLTAFDVPDSVTVIKQEAFTNCDYLQTASIGSGVTGIWKGAFKGCTALERVDFAVSTGWYVADSSTATEGDAIDIAAGAVLYLTDTYINMYILRPTE